MNTNPSQRSLGRLERALRARRSRLKQESEALEAVRSLLESQTRTEAEIEQRLRAVNNQQVDVEFPRGIEPSELSDRVFSEDQIKALCVEYRLRFLPSSRFKPGIPQAALAEVERLERRYDIRLGGFQIAAPAGLFDLKMKDRDPLLFAQIDSKHFLLIHQWGGEISFWRKAVVWPLQSLEHAVASLVALAFAIAYIALPDAWLMGPYDEHSFGVRTVFFFYLILAFSGLSVLYGYSRLKNFSNSLWNSPYTD
jgi:hypothetical protein